MLCKDWKYEQTGGLGGWRERGSRAGRWWRRWGALARARCHASGRRASVPVTGGHGTAAAAAGSGGKQPESGAIAIRRRCFSSSPLALLHAEPAVCPRPSSRPPSLLRRGLLLPSQPPLGNHGAFVAHHGSETLARPVHLSHRPPVLQAQWSRLRQDIAQDQSL